MGSDKLCRNDNGQPCPHCACTNKEQAFDEYTTHNFVIKGIDRILIRGNRAKLIYMNLHDLFIGYGFICHDSIYTLDLLNVSHTLEVSDTDGDDMINIRWISHDKCIEQTDEKTTLRDNSFVINITTIPHLIMCLAHNCCDGNDNINIDLVLRGLGCNIQETSGVAYKQYVLQFWSEGLIVNVYGIGGEFVLKYAPSGATILREISLFKFFEFLFYSVYQINDTYFELYKKDDDEFPYITLGGTNTYVGGTIIPL